MSGGCCRGLRTAIVNRPDGTLLPGRQDTWHGGIEYRATCRRCGLQRSRIEGAPAAADTWNANGTSYYRTGSDDASEGGP